MRRQKTEALAVGAAQCFGELPKSDVPDCAEIAAERKSLSTIRAKYCLLGFALHRTDQGLLLVDAVGRARALRSMTDAERVLEDLGGSQ